MSLIEVKSELIYNVTAPTSFLFNIAPVQNEYQFIRQEVITLNPAFPYAFKEIGTLGNRIIRFSGNPGQLQVSYQATVELSQDRDNPPQIEENNYSDLPDEVLPYLNPSRYCESDKLGRFAMQEFGQLAPGFLRVRAICNWVHQSLEYVPGTTDARTGACDVLLQKTGVCRDYAHLAIALCRALCIPARYVSGYSVGLEPPDFHGFFEAFLGSRWYLFDATRMAPTNGMVRIGTGRDAADTSFATLIGAATLEQMMVSAQELTDDISLQSNGADEAISTV
ncbi:transglutaminase [Methyloprofundus sedimenti]|uniref:Transglutaminase n=1 Tax=Methyloprofundus sedimenti TaxID=1420851 RepID=A0A1V8M925_9GAMM|nr:transglutaminase family protein [Methyloprofundus sedimenti]OQK18049.1 transglutaminase [Methyloprofundus sedimenti]